MTYTRPGLLHCVEELARQYRGLIVEKSATENVRLANKIVPRINAAFRVLRETKEGREAVSSLMEDPELVVRLNAAADSYPWDQEKATAVLTEIMNGTDFSHSATWALKTNQNGTRNAG